MGPPGADRFSRVTLTAVAALFGALLCAPAPAQQTSAPTKPAQASGPAHDMPTPDQLEPGVNTTAIAPAPAPSGPEAPPARAPGAQEAAAPAPSRAAPTPPGPAAPSKEAAAAKNAGHKGGPDRIELDTTDITGNRELPKVMYIVPWKHSDLGDLVGKPVNSLLDEVLQPLDRDVFRRENRYYDALKPGQDGAKAGAVQDSANKP
jgi:hypothetical protein